MENSSNVQVYEDKYENLMKVNNFCDIAKFIHSFNLQVTVESNSDRRKLYSRYELLKMDLEEAIKSTDSIPQASLNAIIERIEAQVGTLRLIPLRGRKSVLRFFLPAWAYFNLPSLS